MGQLDDLIARCDRVLEGNASPEDRGFIIADYVLGYQKPIFKVTGAQLDVERNPDPAQADDSTIRSIRTLLVAHKERLDHELSVAQASSSNVAAIARATASIEASFNNTMSQMWALPEGVLTGTQKQELADMLQEVEESKGDEGRLKKAAKAVADWLFDNAVKAIPTVMPYVTQAIQGLAG